MFVHIIHSQDSACISIGLFSISLFVSSFSPSVPLFSFSSSTSCLLCSSKCPHYWRCHWSFEECSKEGNRWDQNPLMDKLGLKAKSSLLLCVSRMKMMAAIQDAMYIYTKIILKSWF